MVHRTKTRLVSTLFPLFLLSSPPRLRAEALLEESFDLAAGWNSIHVAVDPAVKDPEGALAAVAWESLWTWLPSESEPRGGRWLVRHKNAPAFLNSSEQASGTSPLFTFTGPRSYLLRLGSPGTLRIKGAVRPDRRSLREGVYQLLGPSFDRAAPPSLARYFSRSGVGEHIGAVFELLGQAYRRVGSGDPLRAGAAYWVFPDGDVPSPDPLRIEAGSTRLRFDAQTTLQELVVDVGAPAGGGLAEAPPRQFTLRALPSAGGEGATSWLELQMPDGAFVTPGAGTTIDVAPEASTLHLTFRARRGDLGTAGAGDQAAVLALSSPEGRVLVGADLEVPGLNGVWRGEVTLTEVERPIAYGGGFAPAPPVTFSLLFEMPETGPARLLPCVAVASSRDGRNGTYRLEAALFLQPVTLGGSVAPDGRSGALEGMLPLPADHPLNPYRHRYNPEHISGYPLTRSAKLIFGAQGSDPGPSSPLSGVGVLTGAYEEEIAGISPEPIRVHGTFRLRRFASGAASPCTAAGQ
jgi:hypothetical protein